MVVSRQQAARRTPLLTEVALPIVGMVGYVAPSLCKITIEAAECESGSEPKTWSLVVGRAPVLIITLADSEEVNNRTQR